MVTNCQSNLNQFENSAEIYYLGKLQANIPLIKKNQLYLFFGFLLGLTQNLDTK